MASICIIQFLSKLVSCRHDNYCKAHISCFICVRREDTIIGLLKISVSDAFEILHCISKFILRNTENIYFIKSM